MLHHLRATSHFFLTHATNVNPHPSQFYSTPNGHRLLKQMAERNKKNFPELFFSLFIVSFPTFIPVSDSLEILSMNDWNTVENPYYQRKLFPPLFGGISLFYSFTHLTTTTSSSSPSSSLILPPLSLSLSPTLNLFLSYLQFFQTGANTLSKFPVSGGTKATL